MSGLGQHRLDGLDAVARLEDEDHLVARHEDLVPVEPGGCGVERRAGVEQLLDGRLRALHDRDDDGEALVRSGAHAPIVLPTARRRIGSAHRSAVAGKPQHASASTRMRRDGGGAIVVVDHGHSRKERCDDHRQRVALSRLDRVAGGPADPRHRAREAAGRDRHAARVQARHPGVWSPEDLVVAAAASCYTVTLLAVAERMRVPVHALRVDGTGELARHDGRFGFVSIDLHAELETDEAEVAAAERAAADAAEGCIVTAALDVPVRVDVDVRATHQIAV